MRTMKRVALIMAGGGGVRLWPASTSSRPKQLLDPFLTGRSLLRRTIERLRGLVELPDVFVVTTEEQRPAVLETVPELDPEHVIAEPLGRNTAPCIALGVARLREKQSDATLIALPSDHRVADPTGFARVLEAACVHAEQAQSIATLGIEPDHAATGFGYIERSTSGRDAVDGDHGIGVFAAKRFVEKPELARARAFVESGRFLWNAGIFVMPMRRIERELALHLPDLWTDLYATSARLTDAPAVEVPRLVHDAYQRATGTPIDTAVMEKQQDLLVVPARVGWSDLGSWRSIYDVAERDEHNNANVYGGPPPVHVDASGCLVWAEDAQVAVVGASDLIVVQSGDRVLVCHKDQTQRVRAVVDQVGAAARRDQTK